MVSCIFKFMFKYANCYLQTVGEEDVVYPESHLSALHVTHL